MTSTPIKPAKRSGDLPLVWGVLFCGLFLVAGLASAIVLLVMLYEGYRAHTEYLPATCTILDKRIVTSSGNKSSTYRPEFDFQFTVWEGAEAGSAGQTCRVTGFDGMSFSSSGRADKQATLDRFEIGKSYPCWYDPRAPHKAVLEKPSYWNLLWLLFPLPFAGIGAVGLVWVLRRPRPKTSPEALAFQAQSGASAAPPANQAQFLKALKTKRGQHLAVRLEAEQKEKTQALGMGSVGVLFSVSAGIVWLFLDSKSESFGLFFVGLLLLAGLAFLCGALWKALIGFGIGETVVEVSDASLAPGQRLEVWVAQSGRALMVNRLSVEVICVEKAIYRQGTSTHTSTAQVFERLLHERAVFEVNGKAQEVARFKTTLPEEAMHSLHIGHHSIEWKLQIRGDIPGWPDFRRTYPIQVHPAANRNESKERDR